MKTRRCYECLVAKVGNFFICASCDANLKLFSKLENCFLCNKLGTQKRVSVRHDCYGWNNDIGAKKNEKSRWHEDFDKNYLLCTGCWNKIKPIAKRLNEVNEVKILINKLERKISKCQKSRQPVSSVNS